MRILFLLVALLIAYGSAYPFVVDLDRAGAVEWRAFLGSWRAPSGLGDILGNIALFVPFGYLGLLAFMEAGRRGRPAWGAVLAIGLLGLFEAVGLQIVQLVLPSREAKLSDAVWNALGLAIGLGLAMAPGLRPRRPDHAGGLPLPLLLIGLWLAYRLMPFVPSLDLQNIKDSLKPLLLSPFPVNWLSAGSAAAAWLACAALWRGLEQGLGQGLGQGLTAGRAMAAIAAIFALEILIVDNVVRSADVVGAGIGVAAWFGLIGRWRRPEAPVAIALALAVVIGGLAPFALRTVPAPFEWLPFRGFLGGSMLVNVASLLYKLFVYGALIWFLRASAVPLAAAVLGTASAVFAIEFAQTEIAGRTPEITDPLLVLMIGLALRTWTTRVKDRGQREPG